MMATLRYCRIQMVVDNNSPPVAFRHQDMAPPFCGCIVAGLQQTFSELAR